VRGALAVGALGALCACASATPATTATTTPAQPASAAAPVFSAGDCTFPLFQPKPDAPCAPIAYSKEACAAHAWFGAQAPAASQKICLGFQKPKPGATCAEQPHTIDCFLEKNPGACNFLQSSEWSPCLNELYLSCIEHGDLGAPLFVTPPDEIPRPYERYVTASEVCHWYRAKSVWPR
jgi:hypothetical protein